MEKDDSEEIRFVGKRFKCNSCMIKFSKLVKLNEQSTTCENCHNISFAISEEEYKRKSRVDLNQSNRTVFPKSHDKVSKEEKKKGQIDSNLLNNQRSTNPINTSSNNPQTENQSRRNNYFSINTDNTFTINPQSNRSRSTWNNSEANTRRSHPNNVFTIYEIFSTDPFVSRDEQNTQSNEINQKIQNDNSMSQTAQQNISQGRFFDGFFPFFSSPLTNNVSSHNIHNDVFDPIFILFGTSFNNTFRDNFSSNFRSNLFNDNIINIIIQETFRHAQEHRKPPVAKEAIEKLKRFKMNEIYCKKNDKGELEQPICSVCQFDLKMEEETILVPCGHMYHSQCILPWFEQNNTCPVCRFELPPRRN